jgi:hypothetical protein
VAPTQERATEVAGDDSYMRAGDSDAGAGSRCNIIGLATSATSSSTSTRVAPASAGLPGVEVALEFAVVDSLRKHAPLLLGSSDFGPRPQGSATQPAN